MLDWFTGYVGYDASEMRLGEFFRVDAHGSLIQRRPSWETAVGSFEAGLQVTRASAPDPGEGELGMVGAARELGFLCRNPSAVLRVSGNPSKFLQGHNVAGPSVSLLGPVLQAVARSLGAGLRPVDADEETLPSVHRSRVDVTTACDLGSHQSVHDYLRHVAAKGRSRHGRAIASASTVYFGKHSTRWTLKLYCKHCELLAHRPAVPDELLAELVEWTRGHLRIELSLRRPELKDRETLDESIIWQFFRRLEISGMAPKKEPATALRSPVKLALAAWYDGRDLAVMIPRRSLYRYRREILDATGIDVMLPKDDQEAGATDALLSLEELRAREVRNVPSRIQRSLFGAG